VTLPSLGPDVDVFYQLPTDLGPCEACDDSWCVAVATVSWPAPDLSGGADFRVVGRACLPAACDEAREDAPEGATIAVDIPVLRTDTVVTATGATYRQIDHWSTVGYLAPENQGHGTGSLRYFLLDDVDLARRIRELVDLGMSPAGARALLTDRSVLDSFLVALAGRTAVAA